jgi:hypothetical protein
MFADLPKPIQEQTRKAYRQFKEDPSYPSLRFKKVHPKLPIYSARINRDYRAVGQLGFAEKAFPGGRVWPPQPPRHRGGRWGVGFYRF